ncbi:MAG: DUF2752 domain-containing protein [Endomicrobium sp.]|nr:DUF2752 domain-containing protein [Endomicrobium sp.]
MFFVFLFGAIVLPFINFGKGISFCLFQRYLSLPCPGCGVRTSIAQLLNGNFNIILMENPISVLILFDCIIFFAYFGFFAWTRYGLQWIQEIKIFGFINKITFSCLMIFWIIRLVKMIY